MARSIVPAAEVETAVFFGDAAGEEEAFLSKADLVVMAGPAHHGPVHRMLGSSAERVLARTPVPVFFCRSPSGILVWLLHRPVHLYQLGLGWILASRFAEITHRGRKTRRIYRSVVEVVRFDAASHEVVVAAAWRGRTDWYRNVEAEPALEIRTGRLRFVPEQRLRGRRRACVRCGCT